MASTLSSDACSRPDCILNIGSPVPRPLFKLTNHSWNNCMKENKYNMYHKLVKKSFTLAHTF
jgi:hypothetical protein